MKMKAYLDNNVVSAIWRDDHGPDEFDAIYKIVTAYEAKELDLVTSELTLQEIRQTPQKHIDTRRGIEQVYQLLAKVRVVRFDELVGIRSYGDAKTWFNSPIIDNEPLYAALLEIGLELKDARHIFVASK